MSATCPNCGAATGSAFCAECGQDQREQRPSIRVWLADSFGEVLSLDSRLVNTMRTLVTRPGQLSAEWYAQRRARYLSPLRIFLIASAVFFAVFFRLGFPIEQMRPVAEADELRFMQRALQSQIQTLVTLLVLSAVPLLAGSLKLLHAGRRFYIEYLVFSLHVHAFAFLIMTVAWALLFAGSVGLVAAGALMLVPLVYLFLAMRRAFATSPAATGVRFGGVLLLVLAAMAIGVAASGRKVAYQGGKLFANWEAAQVRAAEQRYTEWLTASQTNLRHAREVLPQVLAVYSRIDKSILSEHQRFHLAQVYEAAGDTAMARAIGGEILAASPDHLLALGMIAELHAARGGAAKARDTFRHFLTVYDRDAEKQMKQYENHLPLFEHYLERARMLAGAP